MKKLIIISLFCLIALCFCNLNEILDEINEQFTAAGGSFVPAAQLLGPNEAVNYARRQVGKGYSQKQCTGAKSLYP